MSKKKTPAKAPAKAAKTSATQAQIANTLMSFGAKPDKGKAAKHARAITKAQRQMAEPVKQVQRTIQEQERAKRYWQQWGKGTDVAQTQFGKVAYSKARSLFEQAQAEVEAQPRYQRKEYTNDP